MLQSNRISVHYHNPLAQGPFFNYEEYTSGTNNIGTFASMDEAIASAKRRLIGCHTLEFVRIKKEFQISGRWSTETVVSVCKRF